MIWLSERLIHPNLPPVKADIVLSDEGMSLAEYGIAGQVIHTPGVFHRAMSASCWIPARRLWAISAMNAWFLRLTPGLPVLADDINQVVASWRKIIGQVKQVYPAHGPDFHCRHAPGIGPIP